jgi:8-oxo-dGTP diphosphatase
MRDWDPVSPASPAPRASPRRSSHSIDVVLFTPRGRQLAVLCVRAADPRAREHWQLPYDRTVNDESLDAAARRVVREACGLEPAWIEQVGAFADGLAHPGDPELSVAYAAVIPAASDVQRAGGEQAWFAVAEPPVLPARQQAMLEAAVSAVRTRVDYAPIAFHLLPPQFTLSDLQRMYELLLGRRLHKASFRRALAATRLVEATDAWRSEGRGRPAQYYRFAPRPRSAGHRSSRAVRFDRL